MQSEFRNIMVGSRLIGENEPTYIIAEIGINHNGDMDIAHQLIDAAAEARVDAVKFQKRRLESLYREDVLTRTNTYEQNFQYMIPLLQQVELTEFDVTALKDHALARGLEFLCTPFDSPSADFLERLGVNAFKIASADLTNLELIDHIARKAKPVFISTGMSYWDEIETAVRRIKESQIPFALLHCRSVYPVWPREVNLRMIDKLKRFGCPVGYSGHDIGITIPLVAASMGASIIEKHVTLDKRLPGPDHKISLEPFELKRLVRDIRVADQAMGKSKRFLLRGEILNRELFGKSLMAACPIPAGTVITREMVQIRGPGKGLSPARLDTLLGRKLNRPLNRDDYFLDTDLNGYEEIDFTNHFRSRWGLIARFNDAAEMLAHQPKILEFHLAEKDFALGFAPGVRYSQELIVHAPEYMGETLLDLCSMDDTIRQASVRLVQQTIELTLALAPHFKGRPKVIAHPGAMSLNEKLDKERLREALTRSMAAIDPCGTELLLENLPPYPWYFGGQWKGNYFMSDLEIETFCREQKIGLCFDLSHAALYCNAKAQDLEGYILRVKPFIRHIHFADGYGLDGEGVQIHEGDIDFDRIMPLFKDYDGTWVPEIWRGHLHGGRGFLEALLRLQQYGL